MAQQFNNGQNEFLSALLATPENDAASSAAGLQRLVDEFPQCGIFQALLAYANEERNLKRASVYFDPPSLFKLISAPSAFKDVADESIIKQEIVRDDLSAQHNEQIHEPYAHHDDAPAVGENIDDETYEEIVGIEDIHTEHIISQPVDEVEKLIEDNIIATDFFTFEQAFGENAQEEVKEHEPEAPSLNIESQDITRYNDDKMPYTFMWWLDKTRREHAGINQPFIQPGANAPATQNRNVTDELQQQYYENIFHLNTIGELEKNDSAHSTGAQEKRKEDVIIERFIHEEPQIKPQSSDKLDNENKAKKSAEDHEELVTETLAAIYTDQMLFHKAIASYKKLMLRFPEKSLYFAEKIEQLEKRTN
jgi:hypothetical protein